MLKGVRGGGEHPFAPSNRIIHSPITENDSAQRNELVCVHHQDRVLQALGNQQRGAIRAQDELARIAPRGNPANDIFSRKREVVNRLLSLGRAGLPQPAGQAVQVHHGHHICAARGHEGPVSRGVNRHGGRIGEIVVGLVQGHLDHVSPLKVRNGQAARHDPAARHLGYGNHVSHFNQRRQRPGTRFIEADPFGKMGRFQGIAPNHASGRPGQSPSLRRPALS